jgi:hypothetical protein
VVADPEVSTVGDLTTEVVSTEEGSTEVVLEEVNQDSAAVVSEVDLNLELVHPTPMLLLKISTPVVDLEEDSVDNPVVQMLQPRTSMLVVVDLAAVSQAMLLVLVLVPNHSEVVVDAVESVDKLAAPMQPLKTLTPDSEVPVDLPLTLMLQPKTSNSAESKF